jgi:WD40 repeat protein
MKQQATLFSFFKKPKQPSNTSDIKDESISEAARDDASKNYNNDDGPPDLQKCTDPSSRVISSQSQDAVETTCISCDEPVHNKDNDAVPDLTTLSSNSTEDQADTDHNDDSNVSSSECEPKCGNKSSTAMPSEPEKSEYELLRERNIARNNARLKALGLLVGVEDLASRHSGGVKQKKRQAKRKKTSGNTSDVSYPTRRSTRVRESVAGGNILQEICTEVTASFASEESSKPMEEKEEFTVSPLIEYEMTNEEETNKLNSEGGENIQCNTLVPTGPRLVPPSGLNAIYSLEFYPQIWKNQRDNSTSACNWLVGAGKAGIVALWNCRGEITESENYLDPVISWKAHGGRWIADARFLPLPQASFNNDNVTNRPSRLVTAANDGTVCHWDLTRTSVKTGAPKLLAQSNKSLHSSGIFSMDVHLNMSNEVLIVTGSKDKAIVVSILDRLDTPLWRSTFHSAKVGSVSFSSSDHNPLIASASDDGIVAIHDARLNGTSGVSSEVVAKIEGSHFKPHSAVWKPDSDRVFATAGLDEIIKIWDLRNTVRPFALFHGHVPSSGKKIKRIHRPAFLSLHNAYTTKSFILSGGEGSHAISMFNLDNVVKDNALNSVFSRGKLPPDVGDIGSVATHESHIAVAVEGGEILMLSRK